MRCKVLLCRMSSLAVAIVAIRRTTSRPSCARYVTSITEIIKSFAGSKILYLPDETARPNSDSLEFPILEQLVELDD